jgi:predicted nucleic acid-binding protein
VKAYIDSSAFLALLLQAPHGVRIAERIDGATHLVSSNLLAAEVRSAIAREDLTLDDPTFDAIGWVIPERPLDVEMKIALAAGYLTGADLWHVAAALSVADDPSEIAFITLDERQRAVAAELGFQT